jgi:hypothetical protein
MQQQRSKAQKVVKEPKVVKLSASEDKIRKEGTLYNPGQKATNKELEMTRKKVIAAYKQLQKKRKDDHMN